MSQLAQPGVTRPSGPFLYVSGPPALCCSLSWFKGQREEREGKEREEKQLLIIKLAWYGEAAGN